MSLGLGQGGCPGEARPEEPCSAQGCRGTWYESLLGTALAGSFLPLLAQRHTHLARTLPRPSPRGPVSEPRESRPI